MNTPFPKRISPKEVLILLKKNPYPFYIYDEKTILNQVQLLKSAFSYSSTHLENTTIRYALKANPHGYFLKRLAKEGLEFDASSIFEVLKIIKQGLPASKIMLTSQEFPHNFKTYYPLGFFYNATSLEQIKRFGKLFPNEKIGLRINPGQGSGIVGKTNVAGENSSFGIWHEQLEEALKQIKKYRLKVRTIHTHIGSGIDFQVWRKVAKISLNFLNFFKEATTINLGGGFKVARHLDDLKNIKDESTHLLKIGHNIMKEIDNFSKKTGRKIKLEIEPGTFLVANSGLLIGQVNDIVETSKKEFPFIKLNLGMNDLLRPSLYGAKHHMETLSLSPKKDKKKYFVVGHCCEEGDVFTTKKNQPTIKEPILLKATKIGDPFIIHGVGAYGRAMASHYNSYPSGNEYLKKTNGKIIIITKRPSLDKIWENEIAIPI